MSANGMDVDKQSDVKSSLNGSPSGKHSHRSGSKDTERRDKDKDRRYSEHRDRDRDRDRDRRRSDRDHSYERRHRDDDRDRDRRDRDRNGRDERDRDRDRDRHRSSRNHSRDRDREGYRRRDDPRDSDERREKRRREDPDEAVPDGKRRKEDPEGSAGDPRGEKRDRSKDSDKRRRDRDRYRDSKRDSPQRGDRGPRRPSPTYVPPPAEPIPEPEGDSEQRSVFVSQLAARLTARDLGYFFEEKLGDNTVIDARIVTDRLSRRSKGIGYVEFRTLDHVNRAINLTGTIVMGLPIKVQLTEAERNRVHSGDLLNLPPGVTAPPGGPMQLYVGSLHFQLTEDEIRQVFEPFGELEFVDLHRDPATGRSKGYCFIQYRRPEDARMALEQMDGFELAGRTLRVNTVHEKGVAVAGATMSGRSMGNQAESLDEGGGNLNAVSRQALMQKLARTNEPQLPTPVTAPKIAVKSQETRCILLKNAFDPTEETESDWDKSLLDDVKAECESKFGGQVQDIVVEKESQGEIYIQCESIEMSRRAVANLDGRWFGGRQITASYISDAIMKAHSRK